MKVLAGVLAAFVLAGTALSETNFSLEYAVASTGGSASASAHFSMVTIITTQGAATGTKSSAHYTVQPVIATDASAAVGDWMLFE